MSWTEDQINKAIDGWNKGKSGSELEAVVKGKSRAAIIGKVHRLYLRGDRRVKRSPVQVDWDDNTILALMRHREHEKLSFDRIGQILGATTEACSRKYNEIIRDLEASERA